MASGVTGLVDTDNRLASMPAQMKMLMGRVLEGEAKTVQQHVLSMLKDHSGTTRSVLSSNDAIKWTRDDAGNVTAFEFGFVTKEGRDKAYYYFWVETGRESGTKGGQRRSGKTKRGTIKYRKLSRDVSYLSPRRVFARAAVACHDRMVVERAALKALDQLGLL